MLQECGSGNKSAPLFLHKLICITVIFEHLFVQFINWLQEMEIFRRLLLRGLGDSSSGPYAILSSGYARMLLSPSSFISQCVHPIPIFPLETMHDKDNIELESGCGRIFTYHF
jgi:hypothetical protein